jgi:hypothetical protein
MFSLFIIRWTVGFGAFSFAFFAFLIPFLLSFISPGARGPVAFKAVSPVIWPEWHEALR